MLNFLFCLTVSVLLCFQQIQAKTDDILFNDDNNHEFDLLIFTQQWPVTSCMEWMETNKKHTCTLPSPREIWTIHGVWPTRFGSIGPAFCNKSAEFNIDELKPFDAQLEQFWINIENGTPKDGLWKHEWLKHGTCACVLPELANENKYFGQGLSWLQQYSMSSVLQKSNIIPDTDYTVIEINKAVINQLNKNPAIHCIHDRERDQIFISEIRICFTKSLELTDCDGVVSSSEVIAIEYDGGKVITNCDINKPIRYPSVVPPAVPVEKSSWKFPFVNLYRLILLVKRLTL